MNRRGSVMLVVALIIVIVLVAAGGIWYWKINKASVPPVTVNNASSTVPAGNNSTTSETTELQFSNDQYSFQYPSNFVLTTSTGGDVGLSDEETYSRSKLSTITLQQECQSVEDHGEYLNCINTSPAINFSLANQSFQNYQEQISSEVSSGQDGDSIATAQDIASRGVCTKNGSDGFLTYWDGEYNISYTCALPINNETLEISWTGSTGNDLIQGIINTLQSTSTALTITPISGSAGTMIVLHGTFSVCGNQVNQCTEDRFDQSVFLQNGVAVATSVVSYSPMEGSGTADDPFRQNGNTAYQVPLSLTPGNYEFAMQNCLGKGCNNYHIGWFTVVAPGSAMVPVINSINPQTVSSASLAGATITIHGNNFSTSDNYISFLGDGITGSSVGYSYIADVASPDGKTIILKLPSCSASSGPTCEWVPAGAYWTSDNGYRIAVSNSNGTSNFASLKTQ